MACWYRPHERQRHKTAHGSEDDQQPPRALADVTQAARSYRQKG